MIALITPTGCRPAQIQLCAKYMKKQTYQKSVLWVIIDDGVVSSIDFIPKDFREYWKIIKYFPETKWHLGMNTQAKNLLYGLKIVSSYDDIKAIFIIEDDDYYSPMYLQKTLEHLEDYEVAGEIPTIYYNVAKFHPIFNNNYKHSSLFQTAFKPSILPIFEKIVKNSSKFIDLLFWQELVKNNHKINLFKQEDRPLSIGIKGLPGRPGIGGGHTRSYHGKETKEQHILYLKNLLGKDYLNYL